MLFEVLFFPSCCLWLPSLYCLISSSRLNTVTFSHQRLLVLSRLYWFNKTGKKKKPPTNSETFGSIWLDVGMLQLSGHLGKTVTAISQYGK